MYLNVLLHIENNAIKFKSPVQPQYFYNYTYLNITTHS